MFFGDKRFHEPAVQYLVEIVTHQLELKLEFHAQRISILRFRLHHEYTFVSSYFFDISIKENTNITSREHIRINFIS